MLLRRRFRYGFFSVSASVAAAMVLVVACTGEDPVVVSSGPVADDAPNAPDASADVDLPCDPAKDFGDGVPVQGLATTEFIEDQARFSPDERVVYFTRYAYVDGGPGPPGIDSKIYTSSRASRAVGFDPPQEVTALLKGGGTDNSATVTGDGVTVFFSRLNQIWQATGTLAPEPIHGEINRDVASSPYVLPDGSAIYFVKYTDTADGGLSGRIYRAGRGNGSYSAVTTVAGLPEGENQYAPVATPDELTIYWARVGGSGDIFVATRTDTASPFSGVHALASVNTTARAELPTFISADGCRLYYASSAHPYPSPDLLSDIFVATKPR
jgi:hypothetical protein